MRVHLEIQRAEAPRRRRRPRRKNICMRALEKFNRYKFYLLWLPVFFTMLGITYMQANAGEHDNNVTPLLPPHPDHPSSSSTASFLTLSSSSTGSYLTLSSSSTSSYLMLSSSSTGSYLMQSSSSTSSYSPPPPPPPTWHGPTDLFGNVTSLEDSLTNLEIIPKCETIVKEPTAVVGTYRTFLNLFGGPIAWQPGPGNAYYLYPSGISQILQGDPNTNTHTTFDRWGCNLDTEFVEVVQWFENQADPVETMLTTDPVQLTTNPTQFDPPNQVTYGFHAFQRSINPNLQAVIHLSVIEGRLREQITLNPDPDSDSPISYYRDLTSNSKTTAVRERRSMSAFLAWLRPAETGLVLVARSTNPQDRRVCGNIISRMRWWG